MTGSTRGSFTATVTAVCTTSGVTPATSLAMATTVPRSLRSAGRTVRVCPPVFAFSSSGVP